MNPRFARALALLWAIAISAKAVNSQEYSPGPSASPAGIDERSISLGNSDATTTQDGPKAVQGVGILDFVSMILVLGLVIAAIYLVLKVIKKARVIDVGQSTSLKVIGSATLAAGRYLHAVKAGTRYFILASTEASVSTVAEITDKEGIDGLELELQSAPKGARRDFASILGSLLPGGINRESRKGGTDFLRKQRDRLRGL